MYISIVSSKGQYLRLKRLEYTMLAEAVHRCAAIWRSTCTSAVVRSVRDRDGADRKDVCNGVVVNIATVLLFNGHCYLSSGQ